MTDRLMIDIETLGTEPGAAILSIGVCMFDEDGVGDSAEWSVSLESCQAYGLTIDAETLEWWLEQDDAVAEVLTGGMILRHALLDLAMWIDSHDPDEIWANSPKFDCGILEAAFDAVDREAPWRFWELRDVRTLRSLPGAVELSQEGDEHDALDDAIHQAREVGQTLQRLGEQSDGGEENGRA